MNQMLLEVVSNHSTLPKSKSSQNQHKQSISLQWCTVTPLPLIQSMNYSNRTITTCMLLKSLVAFTVHGHTRNFYSTQFFVGDLVLSELLYLFVIITSY